MGLLVSISPTPPSIVDKVLVAPLSQSWSFVSRNLVQLPIIYAKTKAINYESMHASITTMSQQCVISAKHTTNQTATIPRYESYWARRAAMQNIIGSTIWSRKMLRMTMEIYIDQSWHATHAINAGTACDLSTAGCPVDQVLDLTAPTGARINQSIRSSIQK